MPLHASYILMRFSSYVLPGLVRATSLGGTGAVALSDRNLLTYARTQTHTHTRTTLLPLCLSLVRTASFGGAMLVAM